MNWTPIHSRTLLKLARLDRRLHTLVPRTILAPLALVSLARLNNIPRSLQCSRVLPRHQPDAFPMVNNQLLPVQCLSRHLHRWKHNKQALPPR